MSVRRALVDVFGTMRWLQLAGWVVTIAVTPLAFYLFAAYRIGYQRRILAGDGTMPPFDWRHPWRNLGIAFVAALVSGGTVAILAGPLYLAILRPFGLSERAWAFGLVVNLVATVGFEIVVILAIVPSGSRPWRRASASDQRLWWLGIPLLAAVIGNGLGFGSRLLASGRAGAGSVVDSLGVPQTWQPRALATYYGFAAATSLVFILSDLVVGYLFAQRTRWVLELPAPWADEASAQPRRPADNTPPAR